MPFLPNANANIYKKPDLVTPYWVGVTDVQGKVTPTLPYGDYRILISHCDYDNEIYDFSIPGASVISMSIGCSSTMSVHESTYDHGCLNSLCSTIQQSISLPGDIKATLRTVNPGWLLCDGSAVSRTTYSELFSIIGTAFGAGNGSTTFNVPDFRGRTLIGAGQGVGLTNRTVGQIGGEEAHTDTIAEMPYHNHTFPGFSGGAGLGAPNGNQAARYDTSSTGGGLPHNNMQPYAVANVIIKY